MTALDNERTDYVLDALIAAERRGVYLSVREIQAECGISSTSVVEYHVRKLERRGDVTIGVRRESRNIRVTPKGRGFPDDEDMLRECLGELEEYLVCGPLIDNLRLRLGVPWEVEDELHKR